MRKRGFVTAVVPLLVASLLASPAQPHGAPSSATPDEAPDIDSIFREIYGSAVHGEENNLFLTEDEARQIGEQAREKLSSRLISYYRIHDEADQLEGFAFLQTRTIRTKPATVLVALDARGRVQGMRILGWGEPPEYQPGERWLAQFDGLHRPERARLRGAIDGMSGASYTNRSLTAAVRWALAVTRVKLVERQDRGG